MITAKRNALAIGERITPPKIQMPRRAPTPASAFPLTAKASNVIGPMLINGGAHFDAIVDAVIDQVVHHIRTVNMADLDPRIADAIEDHLSVDPTEGDRDQETECSEEDLATIREANARAWNGGAL